MPPALGSHRSKKTRLAISAGNADPRDEFVMTLNAAGYSIRSLATKIGVAQSTIHSHRRPKGDKLARRIPKDRAKKIAALTGWPPSGWPAGVLG